jgi:hypothetical protein
MQAHLSAGKRMFPLGRLQEVGPLLENRRVKWEIPGVFRNPTLAPL